MDGINRKPMQDVVLPKGEPVTKHHPIAPEPHMIPPRDRSERIERNPFFERSREGNDSSVGGGSSRVVLFTIIIVLVLSGVFLATNYFTSATINITPAVRSAKIDQTFDAVKDGSTEGVVFHYIEAVSTKTKDVLATQEKKIQKKASGKVFIYNSYNANSQRLIKNTRLESADHKIFRIYDSVVVPGAKIVGGKVIESGAVEATIYADVPGKEYNIGFGDFTIPGFKGDPRYAKFMAKSKPDSPIGGGFLGTVKMPTDDAVILAQNTLKEELKAAAIEKARGQVPENVIFFPGSIILKFEEVPQDFGNDMSKVSMRAVVSVFFFDARELAQALAKEALPNYVGAPMAIQNIADLKFAFLDPVDNVVLKDIKNFRFSVSGNAIFVGQVNTQNLKVALAGKEKSDFAKIIDATGKETVSKADAVIRPLWKTTFPLDAQKITVNVVSQEK